MSTPVTWYGTQVESFALISALAHNCTCVFGQKGIRLKICPAHQMLMDDQRALDGLLFARRMAAQLLEEEFSTGPRARRES
jgi:hypothetical protein